MGKVIQLLDVKTDYQSKNPSRLPRWNGFSYLDLSILLTSGISEPAILGHG
jgi:hypothetical protein